MRVGFFWDQSLFDYRGIPGNPYGGLLVEALQKHGLSFERLPYRLRPGGRLEAPGLRLGWLWRNRARVQVLHLHWLAGLYASGRAPLAWYKLVRLAWSLAFARLLGYRVVWTLHNMLPHERPHRGVDVAGRLLMVALAQAIICHCAYARREFTRRFKRRRGLHVIPHGHFRSAYPNTVSKAEARRRLGLPAAAFVYGVFGNIRGYKGHDDLLAAFHRLEGEHLRLLISGARFPGHRSRLDTATAVDTRVIFSDGMVPIDEVQLYLNAADVMVFPYREALTSGALITALGFARPVISTRVGCIPELINRPEIGVLIPPGDRQALAAALLEAQSWDLAARGAAALKRADDLVWDEISRQTLIAYGHPATQRLPSNTA